MPEAAQQVESHHRVTLRRIELEWRIGSSERGPTYVRVQGGFE
ncbi:hypothetical protein [Salinicola corii]|nr:hypothetical protein [Salinicola corii]